MVRSRVTCCSMVTRADAEDSVVVPAEERIDAEVR